MSSKHALTNSRSRLEQIIFESCRGTPLSSEKVQTILDSYSEPWRHYHNCDHILKCFTLFEQCDKSHLNADEIYAIRWMLIFHDAILKIGREKGWSELQSARMSNQFLMGVVPENILSIIYYGIMASINHKCQHVPLDWEPAISLFLDIDLLAGLGTSYQELVTITRLVEREYEPMYTKEEFKAGRISWVETFLTRERIFQSSVFSHHEKMVRRNLRLIMKRGW